MKRKLFISLIAILTSSLAQAQFGLSGEVRPRTEYSHGYGTLAAEEQNPSLFTSQRTRINFDYKMDLLKFGVVLQDARVWGSSAQLVTNEDYATSIHQAWSELNFTKAFSLKIGRQELNYDDQRILGGVGWLQQGRSHDVAVFKYSGKINVHFGIAHHENTNRKDNIYDGPDAYKDLQYFWLNRKTDKLNLSFLFLNNGKPVTNDKVQHTQYSQTFGPHFDIPVQKLIFSGNMYLQTGKDGSGKKLSAFNVLAEANYKLNDRNNFTAGYEILSGTDYDQKETNHSFAPLYGTNHKFNGYMDYFYVGNHFNNVGLSNAYLKYATTKNKIGFNADAHVFVSAATIAQDAENYLGTELDLTFSYAFNPISKISVGYSQMLAGKSMELVKGGSKDSFNNWAYVMLAITPKFIP
jgi:hypothetical protein